MIGEVTLADKSASAGSRVHTQKSCVRIKESAKSSQCSHYPQHRHLRSVRKTVWLGEEEQSKKGFRESEQKQTRLKGPTQKTWQSQYTRIKLLIKDYRCDELDFNEEKPENMTKWATFHRCKNFRK